MRISGIIFITLSVAMAIFGLVMFRTRTDNQFIGKLGEYSFMLWFPFLVAGIVLRAISQDKK